MEELANLSYGEGQESVLGGLGLTLEGSRRGMTNHACLLLIVTELSAACSAKVRVLRVYCTAERASRSEQ